MTNTLQTVFQLGFKDYAAQHKLPLHYHKAAEHIMACRTAILGGHSVYCKNNHLDGVWYNSCKHRSCPQCNGIGAYRWVEKQKERLLNCNHLHIVFPLPHEYHPYWHLNVTLINNLMFQAAKESLMELLVSDPEKKYLDALPGIMMALHTWGRNLSTHPHIHCMLTEGGFNGEEWVDKKGSVLLPAKVLRAKYQGKLNALIRAAGRKKAWIHPEGKSIQQLINLTNKLGRKKWQVYIKEQFKYIGTLLKYLINYMRGGPLKNTQITSVTPHQVSFKYYAHKKNPNGKKDKPSYRTETLNNFFTLYLQHIPQPRKILIRHYGLYANTNGTRLNAARSQLGQIPKPTEKETKEKFLSWRDYLMQIAGATEKHLCKKCKQPLEVFQVLPRMSKQALLREKLRQTIKPNLKFLNGECHAPP